MLGDKARRRALCNEAHDHNKRLRGGRGAEPEDDDKWREGGWHARNGDSWQSHEGGHPSARSGDAQWQDALQKFNEDETLDEASIPPWRQRTQPSSSSSTRPAPYPSWDTSRSSEGWWKS